MEGEGEGGQQQCRSAVRSSIAAGRVARDSKFTLPKCPCTQQGCFGEHSRGPIRHALPRHCPSYHRPRCPPGGIQGLKAPSLPELTSMTMRRCVCVPLATCRCEPWLTADPNQIYRSQRSSDPMRVRTCTHSSIHISTRTSGHIRVQRINVGPLIYL